MWTEGRLSHRRGIIKNHGHNYRSICGRPISRYHQTCFTSFVSSRNISAAVKSTSKQQNPVNLAFSCVISLLKSDPGKLCNSVELYDVYSQSLKLLKDVIMVMRDSTMLMLITLVRNVLDLV